MIKQAAAFLGVGLATMLLYYLFLFLALDVAKLHELVGVSLAYAAAVGFHYNMNKYFTFSAKALPHHVAFRRYVMVMASNFLILLICVKLLSETFSVSAYLASFYSLTITTGVGFLASRYWIYKPVKGS